MMFHGCADTVNINEAEGDGKLFIVCELQSGNTPEAAVSFTGNLNGVLPQPPEENQNVRLSLTSYVNSETAYFEFDEIAKKYVLDDLMVKPEKGQKYMLSVSKYDLGPDAKISVTIPDEIQSKNLEVINYKAELMLDNNYKTTIECKISFIEPVVKNCYLFVQAFSIDGIPFMVNKVHDNPGAFTILAHKPGFLIDYSRLNSAIIHITYSMIDKTPVDQLKLKFSNTTNQFYRYNIFASNVKSAGQSGTANQSIAPFNLYSGDIWGSVSAFTSHVSTYNLK